MTRNRYVDLLRVVSLGVVIAGHWLMVVVEPAADGVRATNALAVVPQLQIATWLLQVMPVFFLVGGFSHAAALNSVRQRGGGYADFVRSRAGRLLRPAAVFAGVWLAIAVAVEAAGRDQGLARLATRTVAQPLWFLGVYLGIVALAPPLLRLHRALGRRSWLVPAGFAGCAVLVDVLRFGFEVPMVSYCNVAFVWLAVHQLGLLFFDAQLNRRSAALLAGLGLAATVALTATGRYPVSMVGLPGAPVSNMSPPTVALLTHAAWLIGLALLLRAPAERWLARPRVWAAVIRANGAAMTAFLWHLTVLFGVLAIALAAGYTGPRTGSAAWWASRPLWILLLALLTAAVVRALQWADRPRRASIGGPGRPGTWAAIGGMVLCTLAILGFSAVGFGGLLAGRTAMLVVLPVTPASAAAALAVGGLLLWMSRGPQHEQVERVDDGAGRVGGAEAGQAARVLVVADQQ